MSLNAKLKELDRVAALADKLDAGHQEPEPLRRPLPPADPFPIDALGLPRCRDISRIAEHF